MCAIVNSGDAEQAKDERRNSDRGDGILRTVESVATLCDELQKCVYLRSSPRRWQLHDGLCLVEITDQEAPISTAFAAINEKKFELLV